MKGSYLLCIAVILSIAIACDKGSDDDDGLDPNHPRCGYLLPNRSLYDICTENPFPTELHPATSIGANTISCRINDTIVFRNWRPALMGRPDAEGRRQDLDSNFRILGVHENFEEIDSRRVSIFLPLSPNGSLRDNPSQDVYLSGFSSQSGLNGDYFIDHRMPGTTSSVRLNGSIISGQFDFWIRHQRDSTKLLHLTDGRFDVNWYWF